MMRPMYASLVAAVTIAACSNSEYAGSRMRDFTGTVLASQPGGVNCAGGIEYSVQVDRDHATSSEHAARFGSRIALCQSSPADGTIEPLVVGDRYGFLGTVLFSSGREKPVGGSFFHPNTRQALPLYDLQGILPTVTDNLNDIAEHR